jgi:hypothetical protein
LRRGRGGQGSAWRRRSAAPFQVVSPWQRQVGRGARDPTQRRGVRPHVLDSAQLPVHRVGGVHRDLPPQQLGPDGVGKPCEALGRQRISEGRPAEVRRGRGPRPYLHRLDVHAPDLDSADEHPFAHRRQAGPRVVPDVLGRRDAPAQDGELAGAHLQDSLDDFTVEHDLSLRQAASACSPARLPAVRLDGARGRAAPPETCAEKLTHRESIATRGDPTPAASESRQVLDEERRTQRERTRLVTMNPFGAGHHQHLR